MIVRPATKSDLREFYGKDVPWTVRAWVAENDNSAFAVGGYFHSGAQLMAFTDLKPGIGKKDIVRAGRAFVNILRSLRQDIYASCDVFGSNAAEHFGFVTHGNLWVLR